MKTICFALLVLAATFAHADLIYFIPLTSNNTELVNLPPEGTDYALAEDVSDWIGDQGIDQWRDRTDWAAFSGQTGYTGYRSDNGTAWTLLRTTIGGLEPFEEADVWVLFSTCYHTDGTLRKNDWISAGFDDGSGLTDYSIQAGNAERTGMISRVESILYYEVAAGFMGRVTADEDGKVFLLADSTLGYSDTGIMTGDRCIFHGYAITPEPCTILLFGSGGLALRLKRNR